MDKYNKKYMIAKVRKDSNIDFGALLGGSKTPYIEYLEFTFDTLEEAEEHLKTKVIEGLDKEAERKFKNFSTKEKEEGIDVPISEIYKRYDLHIHVPDGATPKDGPSAGIAMATVMTSILSSKKIRSDVAMTGEISLTGDVLPIGGLREKLIAAHRADMKLALIPAKNYERDLEDIPKEVRESLEIKGVTRIEEVLEIVLV